MSRTSPPAGRRRSTPPRAGTARRLVALAASGLLATLGVVAAAGPASAHDRLTGSSPADGSSLASAPEQIRLDFSEEVQDLGLTVLVKDPSGASVADGEARVDGRSVVQPVETLTLSGRYTVAYRVVSSDGHPISGRATFTLDLPEQSSSATPSATPSTVVAPSTSAVAASPAASTSDAGPGTAWLLAGIGLLLALVLAGAVLARRRSS